MKSFEAQTAHRQHLERMVVESDIERSRRGQWIGLSIMIAGLLVASFVVYEGQSVAGFLIALAFLIAQVGVFVYGRQTQKDERIAKQRMMVGDNPTGSDKDGSRRP